MTKSSMTRRSALAMQLAGEPAGRITPLGEVVNTFEVEAVAQRKLDAITFALAAGTNHEAFDRITFRPRMMVNTTKLDLTTELFGQPMFAPILVGPLSQQKRFHPEGELATVRGAAAAKAVMVVSDHASVPLEEIAGQAAKDPKAALWYQVFPESDVEGVRTRAQKAVSAGCKALVVTMGVPTQPEASWDWSAIDRFRQGFNVPLVLKGIMTPEEAQAAAQHGVQGIVVSNYVGAANNAMIAPMAQLPGIADAVAGKIPILIDGSFRRGSDIVMALALGARAVMVGRPVLWGLSAYGAEGVQRVIEMLQTETARDMAMCGRPNVKSLDRTAVKIHRW
jgi:4-hydroxymandelate oxidase